VSLLSWSVFLVTAALFVSACLQSGQPESMRARHARVAVYWQDRQIEKGVPGPPPTPRAAWRDTAWAGSIQRWDHAAFRTVNHGWANPFFDRAMPVLTHLGDAFLHVLLFFGLLVWAVRRRRLDYRHTAVMGLIGVVLGLAPMLLKDIVPRYRPPTIYPYDIVLLVNPLYGSSFPSGHTFAAFCTAMILACRHRWTAPWAFGLAALVGISRVSVGVHWPMDVIAGAVLGMAAGGMTMLVWERRRAAAARPSSRGARSDGDEPEEEVLARVA